MFPQGRVCLLPRYGGVGGVAVPAAKPVFGKTSSRPSRRETRCSGLFALSPVVQRMTALLLLSLSLLSEGVCYLIVRGIYITRYLVRLARSFVTDFFVVGSSIPSFLLVDVTPRPGPSIFPGATA